MDADERVDDWQRSSLNSDEDPPHMRTVMAIQINEATISLPMDEEEQEDNARRGQPFNVSVAVIQLTGITHKHTHYPCGYHLTLIQFSQIISYKHSNTTPHYTIISHNTSSSSYLLTTPPRMSYLLYRYGTDHHLA